jgi:hypothetical protein
MSKQLIKNHSIAIFLFVCVSLLYFTPILEGKKLYQSDNVTWVGAAKETVDHRAEYDEEPLWSNSMFSGMPTFQVSTLYPGNLIKKFSQLLTLYLPRPASLVFLYLLGFYFLLVSLSIDYRIAILGALAFAFSSYFFIIIEAGHNTKALAIGYMAPLLASVFMVFRGKILLGSALTAFFTSLMMSANHFQITYYVVMVLFIFGLVKLVEAINEKKVSYFFKKVAFLILAGILGVSTTFTGFLVTTEYGAESMRGKSELSIEKDNKTSGLDKDYATQWSYGKAESFTLLIPNFHGGASQGELDKESETYQAIKQSPQARKIIKQVPLYWGTQPFTSGPVYAGAIVCFLFVIGLFLIKGYNKLWILISLILMLLLSWGKNFMPLTDLFLEYLPGYNKFRAVSTTLVIVELLLPFVAFLGLHTLLQNNNKQESIKAIKNSFFIVGGICLVFALLPSMFFDFIAESDERLKSMGWPIDALQLDRKSLFSADAFRSFFFILLAASSLYLFMNKTIKKSALILVLGVLILGDMWVVNKRYLDNDDFVSKRKVAQPYSPSLANQQILQDTDPNFRVFNTTVSTFNDASTSYFHKSIGGYHGAKLQRYQELINKYISKGDMNVLNMLNTKYFIVANQQKQVQAQSNPTALGNSWFVNDIRVVENADEEIKALGEINTASQLVVDKRFSIGEYSIDSLAQIALTQYKANHLVYESNTQKKQFAVFSEVYYDKGWNAYIDGDLVSHIRVNYLLRGLEVPAGKHKIEFKFEPASYAIGEKISYTGSTILILLLIAVLYKEIKK